MRLSSGTHLLLRIGTGFTLAFIYVPLVIVVIYAFSESRTFVWPPPGCTLEWFEKALNSTWRAGRALVLGEGRAPGDRRRDDPGNAGFARRRAAPLLRPRNDLFPGDPADCASGHRHRHRAELDVHSGAGHPALALHDRDRPRNLLHRRRLQQRRRAAAAGCPRRSRRRQPTSAQPPGTRSAT